MGTNGTVRKVWAVSGALPGWIVRDLDGNRILLQAGDGGTVGMWTLNTNNTPASWTVISSPVASLITRALRDERILVQFGTSTAMGHWLLNASNAIAAWRPITTLPAGAIPRSMTRDQMLVQAGDGGATTIWDLDTNGIPRVSHNVAAAMPGWLMRSLDRAQPALVTVGSSTNAGGSVTGSGSYFVGASVTLTAAASNGWIFTGWNDGSTNNPRTVTVPNGGLAYTAGFTPAVTLTVLAGAGGRASGGGSYAAGASAIITATASNGWLFTGWQDSVTNNPRTVVVPGGGATYTANFAAGLVLALQASPTNAGTVTGAGTYLAGSNVNIQAQALAGWKFVNWSDGNTNASRALTLTINTNLTANFTSVATVVLLQQGTGGAAGLWTLNSNGTPVAWTTVTAAPGAGWDVRAIRQNRALLQQGTGGRIDIWDLSNGVPVRAYTVSAYLPGWIARDFDGNCVLLQNGDGGAVGLWTLGTNNTPIAWSVLATPTPGLIARSIYGQRVLVQFGTGSPMGFWTLDASNNITGWTAFSAPLPSGCVLRSMTANLILIQAGDGGLGGLWELNFSGQPIAWRPICGPVPGWILRSIDQP
jgi:hypothetical protein